MYAQVTAGTFQPDRLDEGISIFRDSILPAARAAKGFSVAYLLLDREKSSYLVLSLWESRSDVEALVTSGFYLEQGLKAAPMLTSPPDRRVYEVVSRT